MKQILNITALLMVFAIVGCQKDVQQQAEETNSITQLSNSAKTTGGGNINLSVSVDPVVNQKIFSDISGKAYVNNIDRVSAQITVSSGNFQMSTNSTNRNTIRRMEFILENGVNEDGTISTIAAPDLNAEGNYFLQTQPPADPSINTAFGGTTYLHNMNPNNGKQYMQFRILGSKNGATSWKLIWRNGYESIDWKPGLGGPNPSITDYVLVTRTGDTWTIVPANFNNTGNLYAALRQGEYDDYDVPAIAYYSMPFKLTLTKIK